MKDTILILNKDNNATFHTKEYAEGHNGKHYIEINQRLINPLSIQSCISYKDTLLVITNDLWVYEFSHVLSEDNKVSYRFDRIA